MSDVTEVVEEARNHVDHFPITDGDAIRVTRLADALEALNRENEELRAGWVQAKYTDWKVVVRKPDIGTWESTGTVRNDEPFARERFALHLSMGTQPILYKRAVRVIEGPWVEVTDV